MSIDNNEINKVLAIYMGYATEGKWFYPRYTESVDACLSIVEKLDKDVRLEFYSFGSIEGNYRSKVDDMGHLFSVEASAPLALSTALYKCVMEIKDKEDDA